MSIDLRMSRGYALRCASKRPSRRQTGKNRRSHLLLWQRARVYTYRMPSPSSQTPADHALAEEASRIAGKTITAGQVRRWRNAGLLPMRRIGLGRGRGFRYEYPPGSASFAAAIAKELPRYRRLDLAAKAAFMHGTSPGSNEVLVKLLDDFGEVTEALDDPHRMATRIANKASRRASTLPSTRKVKESLDRPGQLAEVLRGAFGSIFGGEATGLDQALQLLGVSTDTAREMTESIEDQFGAPGTLQRTLDIMREVLSKATLADFERARDDALLVYRSSIDLMSTFADLVGFDGELGQDDVEAFGMIAVFLVIRRERGDEAADSLLQMWSNPISFFQYAIEAMRTWSSQHADDTAILWPIAQTIAQRALGP